MRATLGVMVIGALASAVAAGAGKARVETTDARVLTGALVAVTDAQVVVKTDKGRQALPAAQVAEILLAEPRDLLAATGRAVLVTAAGDRLSVTGVSFDGEAGRLRFACALFGRGEIAMELAKVLYLPAATVSARDLEKLYRRTRLPKTSGDCLLVRRPGKEPLAVDGVLEGIEAGKILFQWKGKKQTIARENVMMIRLAAVAAELPARKGVLVGADGSMLQFTSLAMSGDTVTVDSPSVGKQSVSAANVAAIRLASADVVRLTELEPSSVKEYGYFGTVFEHRVDKAVSGKPLRLGGRTYRSGLGVHSFCELTYELGGRFKTFVATVGIDDEVRPNGDATITFLADGKPLGKPVRLTGKEAAKAIRLNVAGAKTFVLRVGFGADGLGFADHVDIVAARLLKK